MSQSIPTRWRDAYLQVGEQLTAGAPTARSVLTASNACVDAVFHVDATRLSRLAAAQESGKGAEIGGELVGRVLARIARGQGGELLTRWPGGPGWITALLGPPDHYQVGGTGPQASWTLATIGAASVLALADRSAEQLAVIDPRTGVCAKDSVVPAGSLVASGPRPSFRTASWSSPPELGPARSPSPDLAGSSCASAMNH